MGKVYGEKSVAVHNNGYALSWSYENPGVVISTETEDSTENSTNAVDTTSFEKQEETTEASTGNITGSKIIANKIERFAAEKGRSVGNEKFTQLSKVTDGVVYKNVYKDVDLEYIFDSIYLKENIVLNSSSAQNEFVAVYDIGELKAEQSGKQKVEIKNNKDEVIFEIFAPCMLDEAQNASDNVTLEILSQDQGTLRVKISADKEWLKSKERVYPVRIDPYIQEAVQDYNMDATAVYKNKNTYPYGRISVGNDNGSYYGKMKSYISFNLPTLAAGDMVVGAYLNILQWDNTTGYSHVGNPSMQINVYKVTSSWSESSVKNSTSYSGLPSVNSTIIDYQNVSAKSTPTRISFDVSKVVKEWYNGEANYGFCLRANDESAWAVANFAAANNTTYPTARPNLQIIYRNSKGIESYWTTHSHSAGDSGTGYVNDYNGNLVFIAPIAASTGNKAPVSLNLVYNGYQANSNYSSCQNEGYGWRLNTQEQVLLINAPTSSNANDLNAKLYAAGYRFTYDDADGTRHYFKAKTDDNSLYEDEDGLGLTIKIISEQRPAYERFELSEKDGSKKIFSSSGSLRKVFDSNGNCYTVKYKETINAEDWKIRSIEDGAGRSFIFTTDGNNHITKITDPAGREVNFTYSGNNLTRITYADGSHTDFTYAGNKLSAVHSKNGGWIKYSYPATGSIATQNRVIKVEEFSSSDTGTFSATNRGNSLNFDYSKMNCTVFTDNKNRKETYTFDNWGRTINVFDAEGNGSMYGYASGSTSNKKANTLTSVNAAPKYVDNLLLNHSFERGNISWVFNSGSIVNTNNYIGGKSAELSTGGFAAQAITKTTGTYTASVFVKGTDANSKVTLSAIFLDSSGTQIGTATEKTYEISDTWERYPLTFTLPEGTSSFKIQFCNAASNSIWLDCAQVEKGAAANQYNLVENGGAENTSSTAWGKTNCTSADVYGSSTAYGRNFGLVGSASADKYYYQGIYVNKPARNLFFSISGMAKGNSVPVSQTATGADIGLSERCFAINVSTKFTDGTEQNNYISFNPDCSTTWQYTSGTVGYTGANANKTIGYVYITCRYRNNANAVSFDNIQMTIDETGQAYTYDSEGNLINAKDNAGRNKSYNYSSANELTKLTTEDNKVYDFTYSESNPHQLTSAKSNSSDVRYSYSYDGSGNVTETKLDSARTSTEKYIKSTTAYTPDGNYIETVRDDRGYRTVYAYNSDTGTVQNVRNMRGYYTYYTYDSNNDRLLTVSNNESPTANGASTVTYTYNNNGYLSTVSSPSTTYNFSYDAWGNNTSVSIGNRTLNTNTFGANNGLLTCSTYGNGFALGYIYDSLDRVTGKTYNGDTRFTWNYDAKGNYSSYTDNVLNKTYSYTYDDIGRLLRTDVSDGSYFKTFYNNIDQTTGVDYKYAGVEQNVRYGYSTQDNLPLYVTFGSNAANKAQIGYDLLNRQTSSKYYLTGSTDTALNTSYSYMNWTSEENVNRTTNVVRSIGYTYHSNDGLSLTGYRYVYDNNGNIKEEHAGTALSDPIKESYTYDSKDQLTRHDSVSQNKSFKYTYDEAGNITKIREYAYTTDTLGSPTKTINYTYADSEWGDLLTAYDGKPITYDTIGNPLTYDGNEFTWEGRSLIGIVNDNDECSYTYNENGIRTSKTVNGVTTEYLLNGTKILAQKTGNNVICFFYDSTDTRVAMQTGSTTVYYVYNLQGDVIGLVDASSGKVVATYDYDAWGNCVSVNNVSGSTIGNDNPFRYRGYYFDSETGFYYVTSRYYNPEIGRFVNADSQLNTASGVLGYNQFTYCNNNPVNETDSYGTRSLKSTLKKIGSWINRCYRHVLEVKYVNFEKRNMSGYYSTGAIASTGGASGNSTYLYTKNSFTIGNTSSPSSTYGVGIGSYSNGNGAAIEYSVGGGASFSISTKDITYTVSDNSYETSLQILISDSSGSINVGAYEEYGISRLTEYAIGAAAYIIVINPECAPAVIQVCERLVPVFAVG